MLILCDIWCSSTLSHDSFAVPGYCHHNWEAEVAFIILSRCWTVKDKEWTVFQTASFTKTKAIKADACEEEDSEFHSGQDTHKRTNGLSLILGFALALKEPLRNNKRPGLHQKTCDSFRVLVDSWIMTKILYQNSQRSYGTFVVNGRT